MDLFQPASESQSDKQNTNEFCPTTQLSYNELSGTPHKDNCVTDDIPSVSVENPPPLALLLPNSNILNSSQTVESSKYTASPTERDKVWTFLLTRSVMRLRTLCKDNGVVQQGKKHELRTRMFHKVCDSSDTDNLWKSAAVELSNEQKAKQHLYHQCIEINKPKSI